MSIKLPKLLAPAGGREAFDAALCAGADEIYMGLAGYGARRYAENFTPDQFCQALDDAHRLGVAVHLTLNTMMSEEELERVAPDLARLDAAGLDAVIIQDLGVASFLAEHFPRLERHASTQMALGSLTDVRWIEQCGFSRAVLPRELTWDEMATIREKTSLELEVFISGALCVGCSGRCYLSSFIGGRSGNRGSCAQPCRQRYASEDETFDGDYLFSLTDQLQGEKEIQKLIALGIDSLKIEGRMKSPLYVYEATRSYRRILDTLAGLDSTTQRRRFVLKGEENSGARIENALPKIFNRGYGKGFFYEQDPPLRHPIFSSSVGEKIGEVSNDAIRLTSAVRHGDGVVFLSREGERLGGGNVSRIEQLSERVGVRPLLVPRAEVGARVRFDFPIPEGAVLLYRSFNYEENRRIEHALENLHRHRPIQIELTAQVGAPLVLLLSIATGKSPLSVTVSSDSPLERSLKRKMTQEDLEASVDRFGETIFVPEKILLHFDEEVFVPKSLLNRLRQEAVQALEKRMEEVSHRPFLPYRSLPREENLPLLAPFAGERAVCVRTQEQAIAAYDVGIRRIYRMVPPVLFESARVPLERLTPEERLGEFLPEEKWSALAGSLADACYFEERQIPFATDGTFNLGNLYATEFLAKKFHYLRTIYLSPELGEETVERLSRALRRKGISSGLSVYGALAGMTTRVTLSQKERTEWTDRNGRTLTLVQNRSWYPSKRFETGSTVYYGVQNIVREAARLTSLSERRYDFTFESPEEVQAILRGEIPEENGLGYGFSHPVF